MYDGPEQNLKQAQASPAEDKCNAGQAVLGGNYRYRPSPLEEMEKQLAHHDEQMTLKSRGITFLRDHPEFNEFITLIRAGALGI